MIVIEMHFTKKFGWRKEKKSAHLRPAKIQDGLIFLEIRPTNLFHTNTAQ